MDSKRTVESSQSFREGNPESKFWIGPDVVADHDIIIQPDEWIIEHIKIGPEHVPPLEISPMRAFYRARHSTRSVLAQQGLEIKPMWEKFERDDSWAWGGLNSGLQENLPVGFHNYGRRAIQIQAGDKIFRCFNSEGTKAVKGTHLVNLVTKGEMSISGTYGKDWSFASEGKMLVDYSQAEQAELIALTVNRDLKLWVPPAETPLHVTDRSKLAEVLKPVPADQSPGFFVTETNSRITMGNNPGVLDYSFKSKSRSGDNAHHLESQLIDPHFGNEEGGNPIRLEAQTSREMPEHPYIYLSVMEI